jgi:Uma2 family endonuclease
MSFVPPLSQIGEPPWEIATLYPTQGNWDFHDYLSLNTNHFVELAEGCVEVLPMPSQLHQLIVAYLYETIKAFVVAGDLGKVLFAPMRVRLSKDTVREPDVIFMLKQHAHRRGEKYWQGADLVVEVVSADDPARDLETKRAEYAQAGIPEYWIVDPRDQTIRVLTLPQGTVEYVEAGKYSAGQSAQSVLLSGLRIDVTEAFAQA